MIVSTPRVIEFHAGIGSASTDQPGKDWDSGFVRLSGGSAIVVRCVISVLDDASVHLPDIGTRMVERMAELVDVTSSTLEDTVLFIGAEEENCNA